MPSSKSPKRKSKQRRKLLRRKWIKIVLILSLLPAIAVTAFLIRYYYIFDATIEAKLGKRLSLAATKFYAAPIVLYPGKPVSFTDLESKLRRLGYEEDTGTPGTSYYRKEPDNHLMVYNDPTVPVDPNRLVEIDWDGNTLRSITDRSNWQEIERFSLKPGMLSNAIGENREKRRYVSYDDIPEVLIDAVVAAEDRRFFSHKGVDPIRILQALIVDIRAGDTVQGASTLTQQFVKNYFLTPERTWRRKFADAYMSVLLEKRLSKKEIFELYSNEVYLGQMGSFGIVGFGQAADAFFDKSIQELTLEEAATLAGIIPAPNRYTPLRYKDRAKARRDKVLDLMAEYRMIAPSKRDEAKAKPVTVQPSAFLNSSEAPYFVDYIQDQVIERFGDENLARSKYKVYTTLDSDLQEAAFEAVKAGIEDLDKYFSELEEPIPPGTVQASLIAVDPRNGHILAMIGGRDYGTSQYNRIIAAQRQPGSIFKPFVYTAALETAYSSLDPLTPVSAVVDQPTPFTFENLEYAPKNYNEHYLGQVTMRQAITRSLNIATIKYAEKVGFEKIVEVAHRLGLGEQVQPYPAMAIGSFETTLMEMARAYTAFANEGLLSELKSVLEIYDNDGNQAYMTQSSPKRVLTPEISFLATSLLQSVINNGTGAGARSRGFTLPAAGKTGTSHDGWFAGYTPDLLCIVWVGFDDNRELNLPGSRSALPIWTDFMKRAVSLRPLSGDDFTMPEGIVEAEICPSTGLLATEHCLQREMEYFIKGTEPTIYCYGNNYDRALGSSAPKSIYASPSSSEAEWGAYDRINDDSPANVYASPSDEAGWETEGLDNTDNPPDIYISPSKEMIWEADNEEEPQE
ncbi:MAG: PBP1A family penicillin-binding protein [Acidobacteria bacterium]|nr:PBP1A family penicillin-binding protein [Acidobacteriota bacterium]